MKCPECNKQLREYTDIDLYTIGWVCIDCNIKIYKDLRGNVNTKPNK